MRVAAVERAHRPSNIDASTIADLQREEDAIEARPPGFAALSGHTTNDTVGPGDVLDISIFEVGITLFGTQTDKGFDPSAHGQGLPQVTVDRDGTITLPYAGKLNVAGHTPDEVARMIERGLQPFSQKPQALVEVKNSITNTIYVFGDVNHPGRVLLSLGHEHLLDVIAVAGGGRSSAEDTIIRLTRGTQVYKERLGLASAGGAGDPVMMPGDRIELIKRPRTFLVLGATAKVAQLPFETGDVSLAEAVARAGGPTDAAADPSAVFLFRYDEEQRSEATPVVYRLNLMLPASYFLSQRFKLRDKDVIYIGNAAANQPSKLISIINQLFSPFITAKVLTQ